MSGFKDHFSNHAAAYAAHRPTYPPALAEYLASIAPAHGLALDCGCGTGQLSVLLAGRFDRVVATDASAQQIANATLHPGVEYRVALAEHSGLPAASVDLITVAQAAHWLDLDAFYAEVRRVARPRAVLALITYGVLHVEGGEADALVQRFHDDIIGPYWPPERKLVEDGYRGLAFPFDEMQAPPLVMQASWGFRDFIGYIETWSAVKASEAVVGRRLIDTFTAELAELWGPADRRKTISWPLSLRVGRV